MTLAELRKTINVEGKRCPRCTWVVPYIGYHRNRAQPDGLETYCKPCKREIKRLARVAKPEHHRRVQQAWRDNNPDKVRELYRRSNLKKNFGITLEDYEEMLEAQAHGCAICGREDDDQGRNLHVDHCHATGAIRGLLCTPCNQSLGKMSDSPDLLRLAATYLEGC